MLVCEIFCWAVDRLGLQARRATARTVSALCPARRRDLSQPQRRRDKMASRPYTWAVMRMSMGFFFLFMAFNTAQSLESTVVVDNQLVNASLALLYGTFTAFTIVAPKVINLLGPRLAMALGAIPYVLLVFANIHPSWGLFIPAFAGVGIGAALLWSAQGISLSRCAIQEAAQTGESMDLVTARFNGIFWTTFQFNGAVGLTVGATIISLASDYSKALTYLFLGA